MWKNIKPHLHLSDVIKSVGLVSFGIISCDMTCDKKDRDSVCFVKADYCMTQCIRKIGLLVDIVTLINKV